MKLATGCGPAINQALFAFHRFSERVHYGPHLFQPNDASEIRREINSITYLDSLIGSARKCVHHHRPVSCRTRCTARRRCRGEPSPRNHTHGLKVRRLELREMQRTPDVLSNACLSQSSCKNTVKSYQGGRDHQRDRSDMQISCAHNFIVG